MKSKVFYLFIALCAIFASCSSDNDENSESSNDWAGFEVYEGTWGPAVYTLKGVEYTCDPQNPGLNNIDRITFIKYDDNEIILRDEYYYNGVWKQRSDKILLWSKGKIYGSESDLQNGIPYTKIVKSGNYLTYESSYTSGIKFIKVD